jgi:hypothetical protein
MTKPPKKKIGDRGRADERRQILLYLRPDLITSLKIAAMEQGEKAYELAEQAIEAFLKDRKRKK